MSEAFSGRPPGTFFRGFGNDLWVVPKVFFCKRLCVAWLYENEAKQTVGGVGEHASVHIHLFIKT